MESGTDTTETRHVALNMRDMVSTNANAILRALMQSFSTVGVSEVEAGRPRAGDGCWRNAAFAVSARVCGQVEGQVVIVMDRFAADHMARGVLSKKLPVCDIELRLGLQMLINDALVSAMDMLSDFRIRITLSAPQVFSRFEWSRSPASRLPMIEVPIRTPSGECRFAFRLRPVLAA